MNFQSSNFVNNLLNININKNLNHFTYVKFASELIYIQYLVLELEIRTIDTSYRVS